jgi:hypothetical protein
MAWHATSPPRGKGKNMKPQKRKRKIMKRCGEVLGVPPKMPNTARKFLEVPHV